MPAPTTRTAWSGLAARAGLVATTILALIVAIGGALRFVGIAWGEPFVYHPDEWVTVKTAFGMVATGDWNPHNFLYGSLLVQIEAVIVALGHALAGWPLETGQSWLFVTEALPEQFDAFLVGRVIVAALGLVTIVVIFVIGRRLGGRMTGLLAAAIVAVAPVDVESSRSVTTDVPVTLLCALVLLATIRAFDQPARLRWWLVAAALVGLATGTKWNGVAIGIVPTFVFIAARLGAGGGPRSVVLSPVPWAMAVVALGALVVATPAVALAPGEVATWLGTQLGAYGSASYAALRGSDTPNTIAIQMAQVVDRFGPIVVGLAILGLVCLFATRRPIEVAMGVFVVVYLVILSVPIVYYARNTLPALPFVALGIGLLPARAAGLWRMAHASARIDRPWPIRQVAIVLIVLALLPAFADGVAQARRYRVADTRSIAYAWILANIPSGERISREQYTPQIGPDRYRLRNHDGLYQRDWSWYREQGVTYFVSSNTISDRYLDKADWPFVSAFYHELLGLEEVFRIDSGGGRVGPTIRIFRFDPAAPGGPGGPAVSASPPSDS